MLTSVAIGMDEVGRGALAGPLVVGAVTLDTLDPDFLTTTLTECALPELRDSKRLSRIQRERLFCYLENRLTWGVGEVEAAEIDYFGLSAALTLAAERALASLKKRGFLPAQIKADAGLFHPFEKKVPTERIVKGDEKVPEIALASVMAKVWRDRLMARLDEQYPGYGFTQHVGYGTAAHRQAIAHLGLTPEHRRTFIKR